MQHQYDGRDKIKKNSTKMEKSEINENNEKIKHKNIISEYLQHKKQKYFIGFVYFHFFFSYHLFLFILILFLVIVVKFVIILINIVFVIHFLMSLLIRIFNLLFIWIVKKFIMLVMMENYYYLFYQINQKDLFMV